MTGFLRVLAVDDEPPALDELAYLLRADPRVARVYTAGDATEALRVLRDADIDVVRRKRGEILAVDDAPPADRRAPQIAIDVAQLVDRYGPLAGVAADGRFAGTGQPLPAHP